MELLNMFIIFLNKILSIKIFEIELINYMIGFLIIIFIFKILQVIGNAQKSSSVKKENKEKKND